MNPHKNFSDELEQWLENDGTKSLGDLGEVFAEKSFAVAILILMIVSAIPVPTGGITLAFQIIAVVVAGQMVLGRRTIWLPARWRRHDLNGIARSKAIRFVLVRIRWLETHSRPRWAGVFHNGPFMRLVGVVLIVFSIAAALAPPLSGLETLPAIGAVVIALAIILEDAVLCAAGVLVGTAGVVLFVSLGSVLIGVLRRFL